MTAVVYEDTGRVTMASVMVVAVLFLSSSLHSDCVRRKVALLSPLPGIGKTPQNGKLCNKRLCCVA